MPLSLNKKCQDYVYVKWEYLEYHVNYLRHENKVNENNYYHIVWD